LAKTKINQIVGGIECRTPSEYIKEKNKRDQEIYADIRKKITPVRYFSEKHPYNELTREEKQSEENELIAYKRLKTSVHRSMEGNFTWLIFKERREMAFKNSEPLFFFKYGGLFATKDLPHLLDICWELQVYGQCLFYDQKRYDSKTLRQLIHDFRTANSHLYNARNIILDRTHSEKAKKTRHTPKQMGMFGRSLNVGFHFVENLAHELEKIEFELDELERVAKLDLKLPQPTKDKEIIKLQYFVYLGEEIFKNVPYDHFFPDLKLENPKVYNKECKNFIVELASMLDELNQTDPDQIRSAYDRKKKYKMKYIGLYRCETEKQFLDLLKKIHL
jgi:hypothetical protein